MPFINYRYLERQGIMPNRVTLMNSINKHGFPPPIELGANRLAWDLEEVQQWLATRPRRYPGTRAKRVDRAAVDKQVGMLEARKLCSEE
jgi:hypothetical protein